MRQTFAQTRPPTFLARPKRKCGGLAAKSLSAHRDPLAILKNHRGVWEQGIILKNLMALIKRWPDYRGITAEIPFSGNS